MISEKIQALQTLVDTSRGTQIPLPEELQALYGQLYLPLRPGRPYVVGNFVSTLDGVTALDDPGHTSPAEISGAVASDRMVMGLLRAAADAVVVGAGTLRAEPDHLWTAEYIMPSLASAFGRLRVGRAEAPLNVIVTGSGEINREARLFGSAVPVLIVTTRAGEERLRRETWGPNVQISAPQPEAPLKAAAILWAVAQVRSPEIMLVEGGPVLMGEFFGSRCLSELFLTLAPQVAGRAPGKERPGFVAGRTFAPEAPLWGSLVSVKRTDSHLFLRYAFPQEEV